MTRMLFISFFFLACSSQPADNTSTNSSSGGGSGGTGASATTTSATTTSATTTGATTTGSGSAGTTGSGSGGMSMDGSAPEASGGAAGAGPIEMDASSSDASVDAQKACTSFAATFCAKLMTCTSFVLDVLYGDEATCEKRVLASCLPSFGAPGTSATPAKTSACEQSIASLACATFVTGDLGPACKTDPGAVLQDGACAEDAQCTTTFCARAPDAACGVCAPPTQPGGPCVRSSCSAGMVCPSGQSTCITPVPGKVNDSCTAQEQCDLAHAVGCNATSGKCLALTLASGQGSCGANSIVPTSYAVCPASGTCSALLAGKCAAAAADGATCSTSDSGPHCLPPGRCVAGKCTIADPSMCK